MTDDMDKTAIGVMDAGEATQVVTQPGVEATQYAANVDCPVCHTPNPPSETYCIDCGFMLASEPVAVEEMPEAPQVGSLVTADGTREFVLKPGENAVGRQDADILLAHNTVSRKHATITVEEGEVYVEDAGSTNGTTVDGRKIEAGDKVELVDGAEVVFGSQALRFKAGAGGQGSGAGEQEPSTDEHGSTRMETEEGEAVKGEAPAEPEAVDSEQCTVESGQGTAEGEQDTAETELIAEEASVEDSEARPPVPDSQPPLARLVSADGLSSFDVVEGVSSIGRREGNDIVVPDPYCSGSHAELKVEGGEFTITDVGSTNGTLVNGVRLEPDSPRVLQPGDELTIGHSVFKIEAPE